MLSSLQDAVVATEVGAGDEGLATGAAGPVRLEDAPVVAGLL